MGTDRLEIYRGHCLCGKGEVIITFCTPDHPWPTQSKWFDLSNTCRECSGEYSLIEQDNQFVFVQKVDQRMREDIWNEYSRRSTELLTWPDVSQLLKKLENFLDIQKSMAACHRILSANGLYYHSLGTFRKKWTGAEAWVGTNIRANNIKNIMELLGNNNQSIEKELIALKELYARYMESLPVVGEALIDVSRYNE